MTAALSFDTLGFIPTDDEIRRALRLRARRAGASAPPEDTYWVPDPTGNTAARNVDRARKAVAHD